MLFTTNNDNEKGIIAGFLSGVTWGLDTVLVGIVLSMTPFVKNEKAVFLAPFVSVYLHDLFSTLWMAVYMVLKGEIKSVIKAVKTRNGLFIALAALMGGPVGMTGYLLAIRYIGPAYTATISSIYPAVGTLLAFIFLKERLASKGWLGLCMSILGTTILIYSPTDSGQANYLLGFIFAAVCVLGWAVESVICAYGMKSEEITSEQAFQIRELVSALTYGAVIIPLISGFSLVEEVIFTKASLLLLLIALVGTISNVFWYYSIHNIGAARAMMLNIPYAAWSIIFQVIFFKNPVNLKLVICCVVIMLGSILTDYKVDLIKGGNK